MNFESFSTYKAQKHYCTTFSFVINLGCYLSYVPYLHGADRIKQKGEKLLPSEVQCHFRGNIQTVDRRSLITSLLRQKSEIWAIRKDGSNFSSIFREARAKLLTEGRQWFKQFESSEEILRILMFETEKNGVLWGFGNNPSLSRAYLVGFTALNMGELKLAEEHLKSVIESGRFEAVDAELLTAVKIASGQSVDQCGQSY